MATNTVSLDSISSCFSCFYDVLIGSCCKGIGVTPAIGSLRSILSNKVFMGYMAVDTLSMLPMRAQ